jgi:collagenase-like PrtC family protease
MEDGAGEGGCIMKLAVGYPVDDDQNIIGLFVDAVEEHRGEIDEVYFAMPGEASGRAPAAGSDTPAIVLPHLRSLDLRMNLLLNANCYGADAASSALADRVRRCVDEAADLAGVDVVTTTSPFVAATLRDSHPEIARRASVNMRIGTIQGMEMVADLFDGFYVQRDMNRDLEHLTRLRSWCRSHGKTMCLLANSGCLAFCSGQTFHDNLVAHETDRAAPLQEDLLTCRRHLSSESNWPTILAATWVRPEDLHHYEDLFDTAKLAIRMHRAPHTVIRAYALRRHRGNLLDLLEPGHGQVTHGLWLDNAAFPPDWFEKTTSCGRRCETCGYCTSVLDQVRLLTGATA